MDPVFLTAEEIADIQRDQIDRYGGTHGVRDMALLLSAVAMPQAGWGGEYFHSDLHEMAAAYLFHIVKNHPFLDGNKRAGAMAAFTFLRLNGLTLAAPARDFEQVVVSVAVGDTGKAAIAEFFRKHSRG